MNNILIYERNKKREADTQTGMRKTVDDEEIWGKKKNEKTRARSRDKQHQWTHDDRRTEKSETKIESTRAYMRP